MRELLTVLLPLQRLFIPAILVLLSWAVWRTLFKRDLAVGLALYIALVVIVDGFLNTGFYIPFLDKGSIRYSEICGAVLLFSRPPLVDRRRSYSAITFFVVLYFVLIVSSAFRADPMSFGLYESRRDLAAQIIAFIIAKRGLGSVDDWRRFLMALLAFSLVVAAFVFWDLFFDRWLLYSDMLLKPEYSVSRDHNRFGAFFLNPNYLGTFTILVFPAAFVWMLQEKRRAARMFGMIGLLAVAFCLVQTQSRGPLLAFALVLPLLLLGPGGAIPWTKRLGMFLPLAALFFLLMPGFYTRATERFDTLDQEMSTERRTRESTWQYTGRIIADNPFWGIGYGEWQYVKAMQDYGFEAAYGQTTLHHPHNAYLQMSVYAGYPALLSFILANGLLFLEGLRVLLRKGAHQDGSLALGPVVSLAAFLVVIYPHNHMFVQSVACVYWIFFGLLLSLATRKPEPAVAPYVTSVMNFQPPVRIGVPRPPVRVPGPQLPVRARMDPRAEML